MKRQKPDMEELMPELVQEWRRFNKLGGPPDRLQTREFRSAVETLKSLKRGLETSPPDLERNYFSHRELLADYLLYYWPLHYQQALSILSEIPTTPEKVLDLCSGPCPIAFAALKLGCRDVTAADQNLDALNLGARICGRMGYPINIRKMNPLSEKLAAHEKYDLITLGHALHELFPNSLEKQATFVRTLLDSLTPTGYLVLIESSDPYRNQAMLKLRETLALDNIPIQAPCVWKGSCPALEGNFPCFAQREYEKPYVMKEFQRAMDIKLNSLKVSYLIVRLPAADWPKLPEGECYRVVSPPFETPEGKQFYLCGTPGKKKLISRLSNVPKAARAFEYLKRGELIRVEGALESSNSLYLKEETRVSVDAACGKPIPEVF